VDLDPKDRRALDQTVADLREIHGTALRAVVLWGEAASDAYRPRQSPLAVAAMIQKVTAHALRATAPYIRSWHRRRIGVPLLFDTDYLSFARDVFPLELLDLGDRHLALWGQDPFDELEADIPALRTEVEEQLRGKMLHLWSAYLHAAGSASALRDVLLDSPAGFDVVLRGMLRLQSTKRPQSPVALLAAVEQVFGVELTAMQTLAKVRAGGAKLSRSDLEQMFEAYLGEVRTLVGTVDRW
jgi:hypothetical protein